MPVRRSTPELQKRAIQLRRESTPAEAKLWGYLRAVHLEGCKFRRQHAIGPFITDFCCVKKKLVIELDGGQHLEQAGYDADRTKYLQSRGYRVLRYWNNDVMNNIEGVFISIQQVLNHHSE